MSRLADNLDVVLHQIRSPDNLGAVARLMANFGAARLTLSDPVTRDFDAARKLAVNAESILEQMSVAADLPEAVGRVTWCCGTTSRAQVKGRKVSTPEEAVAHLREAAQRGRVALVFGGEKRGLSDEELELCQDILAIPTREAQPSMNVSQSVAVMLYLCAREPEAAAKADPAADLRKVQALEKRLAGALEGFLNPQAPEHILRELMRVLERAQPSDREVELWLGAAAHLVRVRQG